VIGVCYLELIHLIQFNAIGIGHTMSISVIQFNVLKM
jgi:hypothetical protein